MKCVLCFHLQKQCLVKIFILKISKKLNCYLNHGLFLFRVHFICPKNSVFCCGKMLVQLMADIVLCYVVREALAEKVSIGC